LAGLRDRSAEALLVAILDPNRAVEAKYLQYDVLTRDGRIVSGIISSESGNNIVLTGADGKQHSILRTDIEELITNSRSLMPEGLEKELSKQQLADVISYVAAASGNP
jgi:putative heme-binding domain-containing protein